MNNDHEKETKEILTFFVLQNCLQTSEKLSFQSATALVKDDRNFLCNFCKSQNIVFIFRVFVKLHLCVKMLKDVNHGNLTHQL